ncbi:MAG: hypothetical protein A2201_01400 [Alicyclobacillus sp. RIFOXYA1_FULL_53_8]|nr:MAG: hypothetical protein A2201_01400 [Alicyclobacillus sp. RIFOXYA1_FULL_53_8]
MVNLMVRVIMGVGVIAASFMAGRQTAVTTPDMSELAVPAVAVSAVSHSSPTTTTNATVIAATSTNAPVRTLPVAEQIQLADTVALAAVGGGHVISVTPGQYQQVSVWQIRISQTTQQWNVLVAQSGHAVLSKNLAQ